jgi:hypothetical protein
LLGESADKHIDELFGAYTEMFPTLLAEMTMTRLSQLGANIQCESPELEDTTPVCVADPSRRTQLMDVFSRGTASLLTVQESASHTLVCVVKWQEDEALFVIMDTSHLDEFRKVLGLPGRLNPNQNWISLYNLREVRLTPGTLSSLLQILEMRAQMKSTYLKVSSLQM